MRHLTIIGFLLFSLNATGQTFTFECFSNAYLTGDSCDICPNTTNLSRSFNGLMIYKSGIKYKWIDEPYLIRRKPSNSVEFIEQAVQTPDKITISLNQTGFSTVQGLIDSTFCAGATTGGIFYATDSTDIAPIYTGDTLTIVGHGATTVNFDSILQKYVVYSPIVSGGGTVTNVAFTNANGFTGTITNPTTTPNLTVGTSVNGLAYGNGVGLLAATIGTGIGFSSGTITATDNSATNELQTLSVSTNTATLSNSGGSVTIAGGGINTVGTSGTTITVTGTEVDGSITNERNTAFAVSAGNLGITDAGGTLNVPVTTIAPDQSTTNENLTISVGANSENLGGQTLTVTGSGIVTPTYTPATNTLNIAATEVDGSVTNEGSLTVAAGASNTSIINSNTSGSTGVTITAGNGLNIVETGNTIILGVNGGTDPWVVGGNTLTANSTIGSNSNHTVGIETLGTVKMHFNSVDGKIGVGNTSPQVAMDFDGHTDGIILPGGSIAQRPNVTRAIRWNTAIQGVEAGNSSGSFVPLSALTGVTTTTGAAVQGTGLSLSILREDATGVSVNVVCGNNPQNNSMVLRLTFTSAVISRQPIITISAGNQTTAGVSFWSQSGGANIVDIYAVGTLISGLTYSINVNANL